MKPDLFIALAAWLLIVLTPAGAWLEATLLGHVAVEIPLLVCIGVITGNRLKPRLARILGAAALPCILLACFTLAFWMIPRWLDASVNDAVIAWVKYLSLPILAGIPLALGWNALHPIARGVVKLEFPAMLFRLGWLYLVSPDRLCNNYLLGEQQQLGHAFIILGLACGMLWLTRLFVRPVPTIPEFPRSNDHTPKLENRNH